MGGERAMSRTPSPPPGGAPRKSLGSRGGVRSPKSPKSPQQPSLKRESIISPKSRSVNAANQVLCPVNGEHVLKVLMPSEVSGVKCEDCGLAGSAAAGMRRRLYQCPDCVKNLVLCKGCLAVRGFVNEECKSRRDEEAVERTERSVVVDDDKINKQKIVEHELRVKKYGEAVAAAALVLSREEDAARRATSDDENSGYSQIVDLVDVQATLHQSKVRDGGGTFNLVLQIKRRDLQTWDFLKCLKVKLDCCRDVRLVATGVASYKTEETLHNNLKQEAKLRNGSAIRRERNLITPFPYSSVDDPKVGKVGRLFTLITDIWEAKPGDILDELIHNLVTPDEEASNAVCPSAKKFNLIYDLTEAMRGKCARKFPTRTGIASLVLALYSGEGPDVDRVVGFKDAPEPRVATPTSNSAWDEYVTKVEDTRNPTLRDVFDRTMHILYNGNSEEEGYGDAVESLKRWVKVFGVICGAVSRKGIEGNPVLTHATKNVKKGLVSYYKNLSLGSGILWPAPLSACLSDTHVERFAECDGDGVCVVIHSSRETVPINELSFYPKEEEILLPPFSNFSVDRVKEGASGTVVHVSSKQLPGLTELSTPFSKLAMEATEAADSRLRLMITTDVTEVTIKAQFIIKDVKIELRGKDVAIGGVPVLAVLGGEVGVHQRNTSLIPEELEEAINMRETPPDMTPAIKLFSAIADDAVEELKEVLSGAPSDPFDAKLCEVYEGTALSLASNTITYAEYPNLDLLLPLLYPCPAVMWHHCTQTPTNLISLPNLKGQTPLHIAAKNGFVSLCGVFIEAGMALGAVDGDGKTALHYTIEKQQFMTPEGLNVVQRLCEKGSVDLGDPTDNGATAVIKAVRRGLGQYVDVLVKEGADLDVKCNHEKTALHYAVDDNDVGMVRLLVQGGADVRVTYDGVSVLQRVADVPGFHKVGAGGVIRKLATQKAKAWCASQDQNGRTPLHRAALAGRVGLIEALFESGSPPEPLDTMGKTPLQAALEYGDGDQRGAIRALLAASPNTQLTKKQHEEIRRIQGAGRARASRKSRTSISSEASTPRRGSSPSTPRMSPLSSPMQRSL